MQAVGQERSQAVALRVGKDLAGVALLLGAAFVEEKDAVAHIAGERHFVRTSAERGVVGNRQVEPEHLERGAV
jgi:hypothetical protein